MPETPLHRNVVRWSPSLCGTRLIHPGVYRAVGTDPAAGRRAARADPYLRETVRWAGERVVAYLGELDLTGGPGAPLWRRSGLLSVPDRPVGGLL